MSEKESSTQSIYFKVSEKKAVSVYGLGRFPVTLYKEQWIKLLNKKEDLLKFLEEHEADLSVRAKQ